MATVAFDIVGTLFTLDAPRNRLERLGAPREAVELWFAGALRDAFALSHAGGYAPFADVLRAALGRTLHALDMEASQEDRDSVMATLPQLDTVEGAEEAVATLHDAGFAIVALTNSSEDFTRALLERAGLAPRFSAFRSCDEVRRTKPHPDVYGLVTGKGETWLVAAHGWDVAGAARAGLRTAWVASLEGRYLEDVFPRPDVVAATLPEAAREILGGTGS